MKPCVASHHLVTWTRVRGKSGGNRSKESGRSGAYYTSQKCLCDLFFRALSETHSAISLETCKAWSFHASTLTHYLDETFAKFHPNRSKFPRVISENDLPDRYSNRRCRSEIGSPIIMMAIEWEIKHRSITYIRPITQPNNESLFIVRKENHTYDAT